MIKRLLVLIGMLCFWAGGAQSVTPDTLDPAMRKLLKNDISAYLDAVTSQNWDAVMDWLYPGLFTLESRQKLIEKMENRTHNLKQDIYFQPPSGLKIYPPSIRKDGKIYALVSYTNNFTLRYHKKPGENDMSFKSKVDYIGYKFSKKYPPGQFMEGSEPGVFHFKVPEYVLAIYLPERGHFTFIKFSNEPNRQQLLGQILPAEVISFFSRYVDSLPGTS